VELATQLLSHSVPTALCHHKLGFNRILSENTGIFIVVINNWYEILDSYYTFTETVWYDLNLEKQNKCLDKMHELIYIQWDVTKKTTLQTFQKGILISKKIN